MRSKSSSARRAASVRNASRSARAKQQPVVVSAEPGERWLYCFEDDAFAEY